MLEEDNLLRGEFVRRLSALTGNPFQEVIVQLLLRRFPSFQSVPAKPHGDGGVDGLSHNQTRAYCCYGLEYVPTDKKTDVRRKLCEKYRSDLRRIFEVTPSKSKQGSTRSRKPALEHEPNTELEAIFAAGAKLTTIHLVSNQYEDNTVLGPLNSDFQNCISSSQCRFVDKTCTLSLWGPKEMSQVAILDEQTLLLIENPQLFNILSTSTVAPLPNQTEDFDEKFDQISPSATPHTTATVNELRAAYRQAWAQSILRDQRLINNFPNFHQKIERIRKTAISRARIGSLQPNQAPAKLLQEIKDHITQSISAEFAGLPPYLCDDLGNEEVARLIGTCPLEWRR